MIKMDILNALERGKGIYKTDKYFRAIYFIDKGCSFYTTFNKEMKKWEYNFIVNDIFVQAKDKENYDSNLREEDLIKVKEAIREAKDTYLAMVEEGLINE